MGILKIFLTEAKHITPGNLVVFRMGIYHADFGFLGFRINDFVEEHWHETTLLD